MPMSRSCKSSSAIINTADTGRIGLHQWGRFDPSHLKDFLRDNKALRVMDVVAERDAAVAERDAAIAEKRKAFAERDSALIQRDVAYADRNTAWMERDAAIAALSIVKSGKDSSEAVSKLMQMLNMSTLPQSAEGDVRNLKVGNDIEQPERQHAKQHGDRKTSLKKRKICATANQNSKIGSKPKRRRKQKGVQDVAAMVERPKPKDVRDRIDGDILDPFNLTVISIPYCSCTGSNQHCYRWGKGGWQSSCCTNILSMYPLPMNPAKCSSRVPGRKMSGGAFRKLLERLAANGVDITQPVDLKNYWAKHGTNRYVTMK